LLKTSIKKDFLDLFTNEIETQIEKTNNILNLRILRIENNKFCYYDLVNKLAEAVIGYSLSRKRKDELIKNGEFANLNRTAVEKFRDYNTNDGETGELLLYCFLESHLNAPKILTKLELKTSSNDYVKGADGIHLLQLADKKYQLVFGESKLHENLTKGITDAFKSIKDYISRPKNNINDEIGLINTELFKEAYNDELYEFLKAIVVPNANSKDPIIKDNSFGIFLGFNVDITEDESKLSNDDFRQKIIFKIKEQVEKQRKNIINKIEEHKLHGYTFYIYIFPFVDLKVNRKRIIENLVGTKNDY